MRPMSHGFVVGSLIALLAFGAGCDDADNFDQLELSGQIRELQEGEGAGAPIGGATVVYISDTLIVSDTTSDDSGRYRMLILTDVPFGQVRASADGYEPAETTVLFDVPQRRIDLELRPARE